MMVSMILNKGSVTVKTLSRPVVKVRLMMKKLRNRLKKNNRKPAECFGKLGNCLWCVTFSIVGPAYLAKYLFKLVSS